MNAGDAKQRVNSVAPLLVSTRQGLGKSTFCRLLLPTCLQDYFTESFDLTNPSAAENKLASFGLINLDESFDLTNPSAAENKLASFGLINLDEFDRLPVGRMPQLKNLMQMERLHIRRAYKHSGEPLPRIASFIGTSNRRDLLTDRGRMPQLKNLMQMERLHIRRAYKHSGEPLPRIASFIGTSNRRDLLTDRSGSRRFICVEVEHSIDCSTPIAYEQLYAQLKHELEHGERSWFSKKEEAEIQQANEAFYRTTPAEEILGETFALAEPGEEGAHFLSAAQIYTSLKSKNPSVLHDCTPTTPAEEILGETFALAEPGEEGAHFLSAAQIYTSLKSKNPSVLHDCTPLAFSKLMAQMGKRVHTKYGNGYWVKYRE